MKTIKELSDSLKISKVSVYKAIKKDSIKEHCFKQDNTTLIDETGEKLLFELFNKDNSDSDSTESTPVKQAENADLMRELLQEKDARINQLLNQINEKDNQINTLQRLLENQQKLQLLTDGKSKVSFWDRFKKKDGQ